MKKQKRLLKILFIVIALILILLLINFIPAFADTKTVSPIAFANFGGYALAHTYIEYLEKAYGWDKVLSLIKTEDYEACFGKFQRAIYDEWVQFIKSYP